MKTGPHHRRAIHRPRRPLRAIAYSALVLAWVACGDPSDSDIPSGDRSGSERTDPQPDDIPPVPDSPAGPEESDLSGDPPDPVRGDGGAEDPSPPPDTTTPPEGAAEAIDVDLSDPDFDPTPGDSEDTLRCLPEEGTCPCEEDQECPEGFFCAGTVCKAWICWPGATTCLGSMRILCDRNGGGYLVLEDCDDGNPCTTGDGCSVGRCLPRSPVSCDDGNPCTKDRCDLATGDCLFEPQDDLPCDDGDPCTTGDHCRGGSCLAGGSLSCGDGNPCTDDLCTSLLGCVHLPREGPCVPPPAPCVLGGTCREGLCQPQYRECDDGDPCTSDVCDPGNGSCHHLPVSGCACHSAEDCDDGDPCTEDLCLGGRCRHEPLTELPCCVEDSDCVVEDPCLEAICSNGRCATRPSASPECCRNPARRWDFDRGLADWTILTDQGTLRWGWKGDASAGGTLAFGSQGDAPLETETWATSRATSGPVALPPAVQTRLRWRIWMDVDDTPGRDLVSLEALWGDWVVPVWSRPPGLPMRLWQWFEADLSALGGRTIALRLSFESGIAPTSAARVVLVDDVSVESSCVPASCLVPRDCTSLGRIGECIAGSCRYDRVLRTLQVLGDQGLNPPLAAPVDVVLSPDGGRIFVSDRDAHRVRVLDPTGLEIRSLGGPGQEPGRFLSPRGLAWSEDLLWVADSQNHRVQALTPSGVPVLVLGGKGSGPGEFLDPRDVALSAEGDRVFVADTGNHRVQCIGRWGVPRFVVGSYGTSTGRFRSPSCVVPLSDGRLIVCDSQNNRLQVLGPDGAFLQVLRPLQGPGFSQPFHATVSPEGTLWVTDSQNHRIVHMTQEGLVLWSFGAFGSDPEKFRFPMGLFPAGATEVWVVDAGNRRISRVGPGSWP